MIFSTANIPLDIQMTNKNYGRMPIAVVLHVKVNVAQTNGGKNKIGSYHQSRKKSFWLLKGITCLQARNSKGIVGMAKWPTMPKFDWFWPSVAGSMAKSDRIYGQMKL